MTTATPDPHHGWAVLHDHAGLTIYAARTVDGDHVVHVHRDGRTSTRYRNVPFEDLDDLVSWHVARHRQRTIAAIESTFALPFSLN